MRKIFLLLCLLAPIVASADFKIVKDEIDEFEYTRTLKTSWEKIDKGKMQIRFRAQNGYKYIDIRIYDGTSMQIYEDNRLQFKSTVDSIATFRSVGTYLSRNTGSGYLDNQIEASYVGDLDYFKSNVTRLMRIYFGNTFEDKEISDVDGRKLIRLYELFTMSLNREPIKISYESYDIIYMKRSLKGKKWEVVKEEHKEAMSAQDIEEVKSEWQKKSNSTYEYDVQFKRSK